MIDYTGFCTYLRENDISESTVTLYLRILHLYGVYNGERQPEKETVSAWKHALLDSGLQPRTVNNKLAALAKYCTFAGIGIKIKRVKVQRIISIEHMITAEEVERLIAGLEADKNIRFAAIVRLLAKTGGRVSEVIRIRKADLTRGHVDMQTKGKVRRIYFPAALAAELAPWTDGLGEDEILCRNRYGKPITASGIAKSLKRYAGEYGIQPEHVHPHAFRHFYAVEFLRRNPNLALLADVLGHSSIDTTRIYLRMTEAQQQSEIDKTVNW